MRVAQQFLRRIAAPALTMQPPQVAQDAVHHKGNGHHQAARAVQGDGFRTHGVERIGNNGAGGGNGDELVEHGGGVVLQHAAMTGRFLQQSIQLGAAFGETEEQRHHQAAQQEPVRRRDVDAERAGKNAQHEAGGDDEDIQNHHMLETEAVTQIHHHIGQKQPRCRAGIAHRDDTTGDEAEGAQHHRRAHADGACRQRTQFLFRMPAILFAVDQVVHHIHGRGQQTKGHKRGQRLRQLVRIVPRMAEQQADEDEAVFQPLVRAQQP